MIVQIMSRMIITDFASQSHDDRIAVVSISDPDRENPNLSGNPDNGITHLFQVKFADVEVGQSECITDEQASEIASYVLRVRDDVDRIIVHCEAGVSRSAGVGAAIMKYLNGSDWDVFDKPKFRPNMTCYRKVLDAFYMIIEERDEY